MSSKDIVLNREKIIELSNNVIKTAANILSLLGTVIVMSSMWLGFLMLAGVKFSLAAIFQGWQNILEYMGRKRIIMDRESEEQYLERYYLFLQDRDDKFPFNIFLHKFLKSDPDNLHDHPWGFFTLILNGGYWEYLYEDSHKERIIKKWRGPGFWQTVDATHTHRVSLQEGVGPCWTLFIPFKRERKWGFWRKMVDMTENEDDSKHSTQWIESDQYFLEKEEQKNNQLQKKWKKMNNYDPDDDWCKCNESSKEDGKALMENGGTRPDEEEAEPSKEEEAEPPLEGGGGDDEPEPEEEAEPEPEEEAEPEPEEEAEPEPEEEAEPPQEEEAEPSQEAGVECGEYFERVPQEQEMELPQEQEVEFIPEDEIEPSHNGRSWSRRLRKYMNPKNPKEDEIQLHVSDDDDDDDDDAEPAPHNHVFRM